MSSSLFVQRYNMQQLYCKSGRIVFQISYDFLVDSLSSVSSNIFKEYFEEMVLGSTSLKPSESLTLTPRNLD